MMAAIDLNTYQFLGPRPFDYKKGPRKQGTVKEWSKGTTKLAGTGTKETRRFLGSTTRRSGRR
jgi:hypothetical protein